MKEKEKQINKLLFPKEFAIRLEDLHPQSEVSGGRNKVTFGIIRNHQQINR